jgi:AraC-like DNA-binding protein
LLRIIADILDGEFKSLQSGRTGFVRIEDHMLQVFEKLTSSDLLTLSADELAAKFGCSRRHLNRLFHHHFGLSIASLRMELRMLRAVCLLQNPNAKVINVAEQCGFNHLGLFNTCFKRRFGSSPGQWRSGSVKLPDKAVVEPDDSACPFQTNGLCPKLGGPGMLNQNGSPGLQLRTAAMAAVLAIPGAPNGSRSANEAGPGGLNAPSPTNGRAPLGTQL